MLIMEYAAIEASDKQRAGIPVWRGRYFAVWPNLTPFPNDSSIGAYHGSDVYMYLGTAADIHLGNNTAKPTEAELTLSSRYVNAWLTFAEVSNNICPLLVRNLEY
jgi:carboxylesterase type B